MGKSVYVSIDVNKLQTNIMMFIIKWVREQKVPVPQRDIITYMQAEGVKDFTIVNALNILVRKGYIKRSASLAKRTCYIQIKSM